MRPLLAFTTLALLWGCATTGMHRDANELRVLVYNIHAGTDAGRVDNLERVATLIREVRADLVLLQEVDSATERSRRTDQLTVLGSATGLHRAFGGTLDFQGGRFGLGVLSRFPMRSQRVVMLSGDADPATAKPREPRGALHVVVALPSGDLHVVDTHLDASRGDAWRHQEAARLAALSDSLRATGARLIVGGDFNATPESGVHGIMRDAGMRDAWAECGSGPEATFPAAQPARRIDYLYLHGTLRCVRAEVLTSEASDHRAVLVVLK